MARSHTQDPARLLPLLIPYAAQDMMAYPVSPWINNLAHDSPECITPLL